MTEIWDLDKININNSKEMQQYFEKENLTDKTNGKFFVGDVIEFFTGHDDDIRARVKIKAIDGNDLYVYGDCYWFPIQENDITKITLVQSKNIAQRWADKIKRIVKIIQWKIGVYNG